MLFRGRFRYMIFMLNLVHSNEKHDIDQRASAVAYSLTLAAFPGIIFLFTLIPYIPIEHLDQLIMEMLRDNMPRGTL
jgi:membrane protein